MLLREGDYPPLRGSFVELGRTGVLYTRGSVPYYGTYPGARVPRPLHLRPHECETPLASLAAELLALTKMNWNSTQFDQGLPIPIRAAREVGKVLRHVSYGDRDQSDYRYYM
jgi:argonaute-like protein implicated in RNA metabolism and viral defense